MQAFAPALHSLIKERLKQICKMPDRTNSLLLIADVPAFESAHFELMLLYKIRDKIDVLDISLNPALKR